MPVLPVFSSAAVFDFRFFSAALTLSGRFCPGASILIAATGINARQYCFGFAFLGQLFEQVRLGSYSALFVAALLAGSTILLAGVVFVERGQRRILINYAKRQVGNRLTGGQASYLPLKVNMAGVMPAIFAYLTFVAGAQFCLFRCQYRGPLVARFSTLGTHSSHLIAKRLFFFVAGFANARENADMSQQKRFCTSFQRHSPGRAFIVAAISQTPSGLTASPSAPGQKRR